MTDDEALRAIIDATDDPRALIVAIHACYRDADRADRLSRSTVVFHLGLVSGALMRVLKGRDALKDVVNNSRAS